MDEKTMIEVLSKMLDERDARMDARFQRLEDKIDTQTAELKTYIDKNNSAIGEILTTALESTDEKIDKVETLIRDNIRALADTREKVDTVVSATKDNLSELASVKQQLREQKQG